MSWIKSQCFVFHSILILFILLISCQMQEPITSALLDDNRVSNKFQSISTNIQLLPPFNSSKYPNNFINKSIEITTQQSFRYSSQLLQPLYILQKEFCHTHQGSLQITHIQNLYSHKFLSDRSQSQSNSWIYNKKYHILYKISSTLKVDAYNVKQEAIHKKLNENTDIKSNIDHSYNQNENAINHLVHLQLENGNNQSYQDCNQDSQVLSIFSKDYEKLYIFSCTAIYMIECQSILTKYSQLISFSDTPNSTEGSQTFAGIQVQATDEYIFWLSQSQGVRVYEVTIDGGLELVQTLKVSRYNSQRIDNKPLGDNQVQSQPPRLSSFQYHKGLLYLLTLDQGVYIYTRQSGLHFEFIHYLQYLPQLIKVNKEIKVQDNLMLIWTESRKYHFVAQIKINKNMPIISNSEYTTPKQNSAQTTPTQYSSYVLNRYFKGYKSISQIQITTKDKFTQQNESKKQLNNQQKANSSLKDMQKMLLIVSQKGIQLFPLQKDVRQISMMRNGVANNHIGSDIQEIWQISQGIYIFQSFYETATVSVQSETDKQNSQLSHSQQEGISISPSEIQSYLVELRINSLEIECRFSEQGSYVIVVEETFHQDKEYYSLQNNILPVDSFNTRLHYQPRYYNRFLINVIQQNSGYLITLWTCIASVVFLLAVIAILIYWRQNKLTFIHSLLQKIHTLNTKRLKQIEFEESSPQNQIQEKWNQLKKQINSQISYKVDNTEDNTDFDNILLSERNFLNDLRIDEINIDQDKNPAQKLKLIQNKHQNKLQNFQEEQDIDLEKAKSLRSDMEISIHQVPFQQLIENKYHHSFQQQDQLDDLSFPRIDGKQDYLLHQENL